MFRPLAFHSSPDLWGRVYPSPYPLPGTPSQGWLVHSGRPRWLLRAKTQISRKYCKIQYFLAFLPSKNGQKWGAISKTSVVLLPRALQDSPGGAEDAPKSPQDGPKGPQEAAKRAPRGPKRPPRRPQEGLKWPPREPKGPPRAPKEPPEASKSPP